MAEVKSTTFRAAGLELHALEAGEGAPVLFVHGWPTNAQLWRHVLAAVGEGRRAIALDLPGFGRSQKSLEVSYGFGFHDRLFDEALRALGVEGPLGLCVHDAGGPLGLHWAVQRAERIERLCLMNTLTSPEVSWAVKLFMLWAKLPVARRSLTSQAGIARGMRLGVANRHRLTPEVLELYQAPFREPGAHRAFIRATQGLGLGGLARVQAGLSVFRETPVRLIYGAKDRILPAVAKTMDRVQATLPQAERTELSDLGHFLQEDDPERVSRLAAEFFLRA
jgi:pimeloyl-ACP methyl ester carboxylesterase